MKNKTIDDRSENFLNILNKFLNSNKAIIESISTLNNFNEQITCIKRCPQVMFTCDEYPEWKEIIVSKLEFLLTENFDDFREYNDECLLLIKSFFDIIENENIQTLSTSFIDDITEIGCIMNECYSYYNSMINNIPVKYPLRTFSIVDETSTFKKLYNRISDDLKLL